MPREPCSTESHGNAARGTEASEFERLCQYPLFGLQMEVSHCFYGCLAFEDSMKGSSQNAEARAGAVCSPLSRLECECGVDGVAAWWRKCDDQ